jgi:hypothetical protein
LSPRSRLAAALAGLIALLAAAAPAQAGEKLRVEKNFGNVFFKTFTLKVGGGVTVTNPPCSCLENNVALTAVAGRLDPSFAAGGSVRYKGTWQWHARGRTVPIRGWKARIAPGGKGTLSAPVRGKRVDVLAFDLAQGTGDDVRPASVFTRVRPPLAGAGAKRLSAALGAHIKAGTRLKRMDFSVQFTRAALTGGSARFALGQGGGWTLAPVAPATADGTDALLSVGAGVFGVNLFREVTGELPLSGGLQVTVDSVSGGAPRTSVLSDLVVAIDADPEADGVVRGRVGGAEPIDVFRLDARGDSTNAGRVNTRRYAVLLTRAGTDAMDPPGGGLQTPGTEIGDLVMALTLP